MLRLSRSQTHFFVLAFFEPRVANAVPIQLSGGNDNRAKNLKACTGECDADAQCAPGLKCFQRQNGERIPGCSGKGASPIWDYCYDPKSECLFSVTVNGIMGCSVEFLSVLQRILLL